MKWIFTDGGFYLAKREDLVGLYLDKPEINDF